MMSSVRDTGEAASKRAEAEKAVPSVPLFLASADSSSWRRVDNADGIGGYTSSFLIYDLETFWRPVLRPLFFSALRSGFPVAYNCFGQFFLRREAREHILPRRGVNTRHASRP